MFQVKIIHLSPCENEDAKSDKANRATSKLMSWTLLPVRKFFSPFIKLLLP